MSIEISRRNEARLIATARAEGVSVDAYLERLMNEWEEFASIVTLAESRSRTLSSEEVRAKIEQGLAESERGDIVDGERFSETLFAELDDMEHKRRIG